MDPRSVAPARHQLLAAVADAVPVSDRDGVRVAVDGVDGAGKTVFADDLAAVLRAAGRTVVRVSADDFHQPRELRHHRGRDSPDGFWLDSYDYPMLRSRVLDPLGPQGSRYYQPACHDLATDERVDPPMLNASAGTVLVVDGLFLHRDELIDCWEFSVFLEVPFAISVARLAGRDGSYPDPSHPSLARYVNGQKLYFAACEPWRRADLVIDVTDLDAPVIARSQ